MDQALTPSPRACARRGWALAAVAAGLVLGGVAFGQTPSRQVAAGQALAERLCAQCHVVTRTGGSGWTDAPSFQAIADRPTTTDVWLSNFLRRPHEHMLNYIHDPAEANALKAYILSLRHR
jgi:mono/diheme cytochrome c family protein